MLSLPVPLEPLLGLDPIPLPAGALPGVSEPEPVPPLGDELLPALDPMFAPLDVESFAPAVVTSIDCTRRTLPDPA